VDLLCIFCGIHFLKNKQNSDSGISINSINMICTCVASKVFLVILFVCIGLSVQEVKPSRAELVRHFEVTEAMDLVSWRAYGRIWRVALQLSDVVEHNQYYYHGILEDEPTAVVSFTFLPGLEFSGMIITSNETWWLQPVLRGESMVIDLYMYQESSLLIDETLVPALQNPLLAEPVAETDLETTGVPAATATSTQQQRRTVSSFKVAVYIDSTWAATTNPWSSMADTLGLFNDVNAIYKAAGLSQFRVVYQKQISNPSGLTNLSDLLSYFSNTQSQNLAAFQDTSFTSHVWLIGSNIGGLSYVGTGCKPTQPSSSKTSVCGLANFSRLFTVKIIAHELGHNRGSPHDFTGACTGAITTGCQCSVMSYCFPTATNNPNGAVNFFSTDSINSMRSAGCM